MLRHIDKYEIVCEKSWVNGREMAESERRELPSHYGRIGGRVVV